MDLESRIFAGFIWSPCLCAPAAPSPPHQVILLPLFSGTPFREFCHSYLLYPPQDACFLLLLKLLLSPRLILLMVVCSQHLGSCQLPPCPWRPASNSSPHTPIPVFRLLSVCWGLGRAVEGRQTDLECLLSLLPFGFCLPLEGWLGRFWGRGPFLSQSCPSGADASGLCVDHLCPSGSACQPPGTVCLP